MNNMYQNFRKFLKKVESADVDITKKVEINRFNWRLTNSRYLFGELLNHTKDSVELVYDFAGAKPGTHDNAMYQALIFADGRVSINGEGLNKRMDKLLQSKAEEIRNAVF